MTHCYLRLGDDPVTDAKPYSTVSGATSSYRRQAEGLAKFGQALEASIHIARTKAGLHEYPDYILNYDADKERVIKEKA